MRSRLLLGHVAGEREVVLVPPETVYALDEAGTPEARRKLVAAGLRTGKQLVEDALVSFWRVCASARDQARGNASSQDGVRDSAAVQQGRRVWNLIQQARVFVVDPCDQAKAYHEADVHTCELAGVHWNDPATTQEEMRHLMAVYVDEAGRIPFPERLPFGSVFLAYGAQLRLSDFQLCCRMSEESVRRLGVEDAVMLGHLVGVSGEAREVYAALELRLSGGRRADAFVATYSNLPDVRDVVQPPEGVQWFAPQSMDPWVVPALLDAINEKKCVALEAPGLGVKLAHKAIAKKRGGAALPLPMPYYVVRVEDSVLLRESVRRRAAVAPPSVTYSHRFDVRGHDCVRVARGPLPLDPDVGEKLRKRGYAITTEGPTPEEHRELLERRGVRRAPGEWIGVLVYWRGAYVKGPADRPYVPATRVAASLSPSVEP